MKAIRTIIISLCFGILFVSCVALLDSSITKVPIGFSGIRFISLALLGLIYSFLFWAGILNRKEISISKIYKSLVIGALFTIGAIATMLYIGQSGIPTFMGIGSIKEVNFAGAVIIWLFASGLTFDWLYGYEKPRQKSSR